MGRWTRMMAMAMAIFFGLAGLAHATTYYIAANGSDSNNGTSKTTPWVHAPGMQACTATCASVTPAAGDQFIFRGGDVWHTRNASAADGKTNAYMGTSDWTWKWSGSSANCNYEGSSGDGDNGPTLSCIYIGVDKTWYSGASWTRPGIDDDNPLSTSLVSSCNYDEGTGSAPVNISGNYVIFDNFSVYGRCQSTPADTGSCSTGQAYIGESGTYDVIKDSYFHGWTIVSGTCNNSPMIETSGSVSHDDMDYDVIDGTDSYCPGPNNYCSGSSVGNGMWVIEHSVFRRVSNGMFAIGTLHSAHDNTFDYIYEGIGSTHGDLLFMYGNHDPSGTSVLFYNNKIGVTNQGQTVALTSAHGDPIYVFNNVFYTNGNPTNCMIFYSNDNVAAPKYVANNTVNYPCNFASDNGGGNPDPPVGTVYEENNHFIGFSSLAATHGGRAQTYVNNGGNLIMSSSTAASEGYTSGNSYQPTSTSGGTYHAGNNMSSSCSTYSGNSELCSGSSGGYTDTAGSGDVPTPLILSQPARGSSWDAGAYQFSGQAVVAPTPPTGLVASVQ